MNKKKDDKTLAKSKDKPLAKVKYTLKQRNTVANYFNARNKETYGNLAESAVQAGYSRSYANSIVRNTPWILELKEQLQNYTPDHIYRGFQDVAINGEYDRDKLKALELMGKAQGMFVDRVQSDVHVTFVNEVPRPASESIIEGERVDAKE